jgi:CRISPR-associated protein Csm5
MNRVIFMLTPLTPLHIGAGETLEAYEYVVIDSKVYSFSPEQVLGKLSHGEREEFVNLLGTSLGDLHGFLRRRKELVAAHCDYTIPMTDEARRLYAERLSNPRSDLSIHPFIKTGHKPFIPGSSLKGAIRTAMLYSKARHPITEDNARRLEQEILDYSKITDDPFKNFKLSDSQPSPHGTRLATVAVFTRKANTWQAGIPMLREVTNSKMTSDSPESFAHTVELKEEAGFDIKELIRACRQFYDLHLEREARHLDSLPESREIYHRLLNLRNSLNPDSFLLRLGWGSGFDAITLNYAMARRIEKRSSRLAEPGMPLGWVEIALRPC